MQRFRFDRSFVCEPVNSQSCGQIRMRCPCIGVGPGMGDKFPKNMELWH